MKFCRVVLLILLLAFLPACIQLPEAPKTPEQRLNIANNTWLATQIIVSQAIDNGKLSQTEIIAWDAARVLVDQSIETARQDIAADGKFDNPGTLLDINHAAAAAFKIYTQAGEGSP